MAAIKYTEQEFQEIREAYLDGFPIEVIADTFNKSVASIRMKLVKSGDYVKQIHSGSTGKVPSTNPITKKAQPTTKSGVLAAYKAAEAQVGIALV